MSLIIWQFHVREASFYDLKSSVYGYTGVSKGNDEKESGKVGEVLKEGDVVSQLTSLSLNASPPPSILKSSTTTTALTTEVVTEAAATASVASNVAIHEKMIVMARIKTDNTDWVQNELQDWESSIYQADDPTAPLHTPYNKGKESMAYLQYIIENYENLAVTIAFVHSHRDGWPKAWHTDNPKYSNPLSLQQLNTSFVQENGYVNLRCKWSPGCPEEVQPFNPKEGKEWELNFQDAWPYMFNNTDLPERIAAACCAQFAVSKAQVLERPLEDYIRFRQWLIETELENDVSGRVMEYLWHIIFGKPPVYCPNPYQCNCNVYGDKGACRIAESMK